MSASRRPRVLSHAVLLLLLGAGCRSSSSKPSGADLVRGDEKLLSQYQPADIAVAPVRNESSNQDVPTDLLRSGFERVLVEKFYSPLDPHYVDANWIEASFRGTPAPDGLFLARITQWDTSRLLSVGRVEAAADLFLFEGGSTSGRLLWGTTVKRSIDLSDGTGIPRGPFDQLVPEAAKRFAADALSLLPNRDPLRAPRN